MRVVNSSMYRNYTSSLNKVHSQLNKSFNKISSSKAYETAADNPLAYYAGKKMDNQHQDAQSKLQLLTDIQNRIYQQELGARDIKSVLSEAKQRVIYARTATSTGESDIRTHKEDLLQKLQLVVNDLNTQYEDFYVYGGNDVNTTPFSMNADMEKMEMTLTYRHTFPGEKEPTEFTMTFKDHDPDGKGDYAFDISVDGQPVAEYQRDGKYDIVDKNGMDKVVKAMSEQGRVDIGYGLISDRSTLLDTYTGGLNVLTGLSSDTVIAQDGQNKAEDLILERLNKSPFALIGKAALAIQEYEDASHNESDEVSAKKAKAIETLGQTIEEMSATEQNVTTVYSDLGNKYQLLETMETKLNAFSDSLKEQYKDKLGADPYEAIMEMFNNQYSYNAALQVGSKIMGSSLFDFIS